MQADQPYSFEVESTRDINPMQRGEFAPHGQSGSANIQLSVGGESTEDAGSFLHRHRTGSSVVQSFLESMDQKDGYRRICGCWWSGNMRVLFVTAVLFSIITAAQTVAAEISNSEALLADCISMAVDALTYFLNMFVEVLKGKSLHRPAQLLVPAISVSLLIYFTIQVVHEALPNLYNYEEDEGGVDPWIVLAFAVWGILFDLASIYYFHRNAKRSGSGLGINMMAAFLHVGADLTRSTTTLVESILIIRLGFNSTVTDAWACLIVSAIILVGAAFAVFEWVMDARKGCTSRQ
eukprot:TRINITY_DN52185_c0_g1_i1.p1 TRINITY_DN52185_c0_g1~~TRINITY_DN52185_c0_g1_i1.p1  ORF type:complete len:293 (+),score=24.89 TRINITY_DN52185_c0_g1_i1:78-956(+)